MVDYCQPSGTNRQGSLTVHLHDFIDAGERIWDILENYQEVIAPDRACAREDARCRGGERAVRA
jgi:type VI protein secretion system component VasF